ncbi:hypothetical protein DFA_00181 [Cavenderia fasciculata]|uniref:Uncharacterized protein n=1 Tax=Cavenderia fasciculata TaxID=261658 RepID=F4PXU3_CACFS|nr:uncharacterized protein DFA_00181 [Cavenderia fasciculata]EGG19603.1 hypothetical protein DFA_00181 [Cavenderia fasciculata]|eukprot:XP_004357897.1 hypothetical protein DFA_00181 [Cavenderia fasciculata]
MNTNEKNDQHEVEQQRIELQQLFKQQQQQSSDLDERLFRRVWNNVLLRRLIGSKIGECIPLSAENRILLREHCAVLMGQYKKNPKPFRSKCNREFYECPVITASLFQSHYDHVKWTDMEYVIYLVSGNPRNAVDTWLFRRACEYFKRCHPYLVLTKTPLNTWRNIIRSNNVELYNYAKTVIPMPNDIEDIKKMVALATNPSYDNSYYHSNGAISRPSNTKLLKALLKDVRLILDPLQREIQWLEYCDYQRLIVHGPIGIAETIHKYAGDYYHPANSALMIPAIQSKQVESIRFLYKVCKIPIGPLAMLEVVHTCDLSFIKRLHDIEPEAGRLYTLFIHVMSINFSKGPVQANTTFQQEFYQLGKQLNYIDIKLQHQIDTNMSFHYQMKNQQHFKMFEQQNIDHDNSSAIPTLSSFSFDD